jgi:hypothetical protein
VEGKHKEQIEAIIGGMECPKDFLCYKSGFENLCKASNVDYESLLDCLEENAQNCVFALSFGFSSYFCRCPLRVYLAKNLKR